MGMVPYFAHKWNQTLATKLHLVFVNIRNSAKVINKNACTRKNKWKVKTVSTKTKRTLLDN